MRIAPLIYVLLSACDPSSVDIKDGAGLDTGDSTVTGDDSAGGDDSHGVDDSSVGDDSGTACEPTEEICNDVDDDCDGLVDEGLLVTAYTDADADGYGDPDTETLACEGSDGLVDNADDCMDSDEDVFPGSTATETPGDGVDTDCDGLDACTDLTCDGVPDLVIAGFYDGDYYANTYIFPQSGGLDDGDGLALPGLGAEDVAAADLDGDGYQDLVLANYQNGSTRSVDSYIYWGSADGYSEDNRTDLPTDGALDVEIQDLDEDGYLDLIFANYRTEASWTIDSVIYWGSAHGYSESDRDELATNGARVVKAADLDGDGDTDLIFCGLQEAASTYATTSTVYWSTGGAFASRARTDLPTTGCRDVEAADLDGDGLLDLVFANFYDGRSYEIDSVVYWNTGLDYSEEDATLLPTQGSIDVEVGDIDDDGDLDLVFAGFVGDGESEPGETRVFHNTRGSFDADAYDALQTPGAEDLLVTDLDSDDYPELVVGRTYTDGNYELESYVYWGSASGWSDRDQVALSTVGAQGVAARDADGDGLIDLVFASTTGTSGIQAMVYAYWGQDDGISTTWDSGGVDTLKTPSSRSAPLWVGRDY